MLSISESSDQLTIYSSATESVVAVQNASPRSRPYLHPLVGPDGVGIATEDAPPHHPWQHGLYFGLNKVNGVGFWTEGLHPKGPGNDGRIVATGSSMGCSGDMAKWSVSASWRDTHGSQILTDKTAFALQDDDETYWIDLAWQLTATVHVRFGQSSYGGLFLRMPFDEMSQAALLSSEGATTPAEAEGRRARWLAVAVKLKERSAMEPARQHVCIAVMDHPSNPEHPVPWRADNKYGFGPSRCIAGGWELEAGQTATFRHRALVSIGLPQHDLIERSYRSFSETQQ